MNNEEKTKSKFNVIFKLINKFKEVWLTSNDYEKSFIETTLGAAIFYLPTTKKTFSGLISEEASKISKKKWVKEHQYPRKLSAKFILTNPPKNVDEFKKSINMAKKYKNVEILWASVREPYNFLQAKQLGCHIITIPPSIIEKIENFGKTFYQLTIETVKGFLKDSKKSRFKI